MKYFWLLAVCFSVPSFAVEIGPSTKLPLPRFASLKNAEANVRTGPGTRYPIAWVYRREGMPVEIIEEYEHWRKIRDFEGATGWAHKTMLEGKRRALVRGKAPVTVFTDSSEDANALLKVEPKVIVQLVSCGKSWCKIQIEGQKGWLKKEQMWGVYDAEEVK